MQQLCDNKIPSPSGSARKKISKRPSWLLEKLQFLAPHVATRSSVSNMESVSMDTLDIQHTIRFNLLMKLLYHTMSKFI